MNVLAKQLATVFGVGHAPISGTVASAVALPIGWFIALFFGWAGLLIAALAASLVGIWACGHYARVTMLEDPSECVLDEVAGQWLALLPLAMFGFPYDWLGITVAFLLFRILDILKPWPIYRLEQLKGGLGIMADDIAAGLVAGAILSLGLWIGWF